MSRKRASSSPTPMKVNRAKTTSTSWTMRFTTGFFKVSVSRSHRRSSLHACRYSRRQRGSIGHERGDGPEDHDDQARPDPGHHGIQVRLDDGTPGLFIPPFIDNIKVVHKQEILRVCRVDRRDGL